MSRTFSRNHMRILLIEPDDRMTPGINFGGVIQLEPLSLEQIAASVEDHDVYILDLRRAPNPLSCYLSSFRPEVVGITGFSAQHDQMVRVLEESKEAGAFTVAGGPHASFAFKDIPFLDVAVIGEGESTFKDLIECLSAGVSPELVPNLALNNDGDWTVRRGPYRPLWPLPLRRFIDSHSYKAFSTDAVVVEAARGCPQRCTFCLTPKMYRGAFRLRPVETVVDALSSRPEILTAFFDPNFLAPELYYRTLAEKIREAGLDKFYTASVRADSIVGHEELVARWAEIGLGFVFIGFEAYSQRQLDSYNKWTKLDYNEKAVAVLNENHILSVGTLLVDPGWGRKEMEDCIEYAGSLKADLVLFSILTPFPGSSLSQAQRITKPFSMFDSAHVVTDTSLPASEFYSLYTKMNQKTASFSSVASMMRKLWHRNRVSLPIIWSMLKLWRYAQSIKFSDIAPGS